MKVNIFVYLILISNAVTAEVITLDEMPDKMILPCVREIPIEKLTTAIIPMMPFRGVNLIFPFELNSEVTNYSLSGSDLWKVEKSLASSNIVTLSFAKFKDDYSTVQDLTISTENFIFSLALHAVNNPMRHCTNIKFTLSEEELKRLEESEKKKYIEALASEHEEKLLDLDNQVNEKALLLVAGLANKTPKKSRIKEEGAIKFSNGDEAVVYVKDKKV